MKSWYKQCLYQVKIGTYSSSLRIVKTKTRSYIPDADQNVTLRSVFTTVYLLLTAGKRRDVTVYLPSKRDEGNM